MENREAPAGYASTRLSWTEDSLLPNDREVLGMLYVRVRALQGLPSTSSDYPRYGLRCADLAWIISRQRCALRKRVYDIVLMWRKRTDWKTFECIRSNGGAGETGLIRQSLDHQSCQQIIGEVKPEGLLRNACATLMTRT